MIDTHAHLDGEEFAEDRAEVMARAKETGVSKVLIPAIDYSSSVAVMQLCAQYPDFAYPMIGLHPEEVKENWREELEKIREYVFQDIIGIGEVGLDFYWSREYEKEQLAAFDEQVQWSIETRLPLMIHCRKGQNEMVHLLKQYERELPGGVFHCFTGNEREAADFLQFDRACSIALRVMSVRQRISCSSTVLSWASVVCSRLRSRTCLKSSLPQYP